MNLLLRTAAVAVLLASVLPAQYPDMIYYKFDEGGGSTTANLAQPFVGNTVAPVTGHTLDGAGQSGTCLVAATASSTSNFVDTGWVTNFPAAGWTISFWADVSFASTGTLYYAFGDSTANGFRAFYNGAAGVGNCVMRDNALADTVVAGAGVGGPHVVTFVFDPSVPATMGYLDGALVATTPQTLTPSGTANFRVAGYTSSTWSANVLMDEFRLYGRALTATEIAATWSTSLQQNNILELTQAPGTGDLSVSLTMISPTGTEGLLLLSTDTSGTAGNGPFFGIRPDAVTWAFITSPLSNGNLFHFPVPSPTGYFPNSPFVFPAGYLTSLNGISLDVVAVLLRPGFAYDGKSGVVRHTFQ